MVKIYYNEFDQHAADWLENLIAQNLIAPDDVDRRSIMEVKADDLKGFTQCHFFAGIGGWSLALRAAGWPDDRPVWTGSCPCQPFSAAGRQKGQDDARHLWPAWKNLIAERKPATLFGEQVASALAHGWWDEVAVDLEGLEYAVAAAVIPACAAGAFHRRDRLWFVADAEGIGRREGRPEPAGEQGRSGAASASGADNGTVADARGGRCDKPGEGEIQQPGRTEAIGGSDIDWLPGPDGKARPVKSGIRLLVDGVSGRVAVRRPVQRAEAETEEHWYSRTGALKGFGNAIDPRPAREFIAAYMEFNPNFQISS